MSNDDERCQLVFGQAFPRAALHEFTPRKERVRNRSPAYGESSTGTILPYIELVDTVTVSSCRCNTDLRRRQLNVCQSSTVCIEHEALRGDFVAVPTATANLSHVPIWRAFLQATSSRFTCYYLLAFYAGLAGAGQARPAWLLLGLAYWFVYSTATELLNRLTDRAADEVNRPERTALCLRIGYGRLRAAAFGCYGLVLALGAVWLVLVPSWAVAGLIALADFLSVNYSTGLRLSRSRYLSLVVLAFPFIGSLTGGWALAHPRLTAADRHDLLTHAGPVLLVGGLALASLSGVKDITDMLGDHLKGYRSGWLWLVHNRAAAVGATVAALPFIATVALVLAGAAAPRYLVLLALLPAALLLANGSRLGGDAAQRMAVREFFYNYWVVFLATLTVLYVATVPAFIFAVACLTGWRLATVYLHWTEDTSLAWWGTVLRMTRQRHPTTAITADTGN